MNALTNYTNDLAQTASILGALPDAWAAYEAETAKAKAETAKKAKALAKKIAKLQKAYEASKKAQAESVARMSVTCERIRAIGAQIAKG